MALQGKKKTEYNKGYYKKQSGPQYYWARKEFNYNGKDLKYGEVIQLENCRNDLRLVNLDYLRAVPKGTEMAKCELDDKLFIDYQCLSRHLLAKEESVD